MTFIQDARPSSEPARDAGSRMFPSICHRPRPAGGELRCLTSALYRTDLQDLRASTLIGPASYRNISDAFAAFHANLGSRTAQHVVESFDRDVARLLPGFYGIEPTEPGARYSRQQGILRAVSEFHAIRGPYAMRSSSFWWEFEEAFDDLCEAIADFWLRIPVHVLHAIGGFASAFRSVDGELCLMFGVDALATASGEQIGRIVRRCLFQAWHLSGGSPHLSVAAKLWSESLAVHVADALTPPARGEIPVGLDVKQGEQRRDKWSPPFLSLIKSALASHSHELERELFGIEGFPDSRLSWEVESLGREIVRRAARSRDLRGLVHMPMPEAMALVESIVDDMLAGACEH